MSALAIKAHQDSEIAHLVHESRNIRQIADTLVLNRSQVRFRAGLIGVIAIALVNAQRQRETRRRQRDALINRRVGYCGSRVADALPPVRVNRSASDLARALRANQVALASFDPSHLLTCFHVAGLTLEDIEAGVGIPPVEAVAAIRRAHHGLHP